MPRALPAHGGSWDEWFRAFDENQLAFLYQDEPDSRFNKLVDRSHADGDS